MHTDEAMARLESLLGELRSDPMRQNDVLVEVRGLVAALGDPSAVHARLREELATTDDDDLWSAVDVVLVEAAPPSADWLPNLHTFRPGVESICARAMALGAAWQQWAYERALCTDEADDDRPWREASRHRWLVADVLDLALSEDERAAVAQAPGEWSDATYDAFAWRAEALGVLLWAVGLVEDVPEYDEELDENALLDAYEDLLEGRAEPVPRPWEEVLVQGRRARDWHARSKSTPAADAVAANIAYQRQYAFVWLCGGYYDWDAVPCANDDGFGL